VATSQYELNKQQARNNITLQPNRALVSRALPEEDAVMLDSPLSPGQSRTVLGHPFFGVNSWIRVMPEAGTEVLTTDRGDSVGSAITGYLASGMIQRHRQGKAEQLLLRVLNPGEMELMSSGRAYVFLGAGGDLELRGGMIRTDLLQSEQEHVSMAPTYVRRLHLGDPAVIGWQERFGIVKRPDPAKPSAFQKYVRRIPSAASMLTTAAESAAAVAASAAAGEIPTSIPAVPMDFAFEYGRWLSGNDGNLLCSFQEGHIYDDQGVEKKQGSTTRPLRVERILADYLGTASHTFQIDQELNILLTNTSVFSRECKLQLGPLVTLDVSADQQKFSFLKTGTLTYGTSCTVTSPKWSLNSANVNFGANPILSAVLGTTLVNAVLTPLITVLQTFFQLYGVDVALSGLSPQTVAAGATASAVLASVSGQLQNCLSKQMKMSG
jgi:hypothetical protein